MLGLKNDVIFTLDWEYKNEMEGFSKIKKHNGNCNVHLISEYEKYHI